MEGLARELLAAVYALQPGGADDEWRGREGMYLRASREILEGTLDRATVLLAAAEVAVAENDSGGRRPGARFNAVLGAIRDGRWRSRAELRESRRWGLETPPAPDLERRRRSQTRREVGAMLPSYLLMLAMDRGVELAESQNPEARRLASEYRNLGDTGEQAELGGWAAMQLGWVAKDTGGCWALTPAAPPPPPAETLPIRHIDEAWAANVEYPDADAPQWVRAVEHRLRAETIRSLAAIAQGDDPAHPEDVRIAVMLIEQIRADGEPIPRVTILQPALTSAA